MTLAMDRALDLSGVLPFDEECEAPAPVASDILTHGDVGETGFMVSPLDDAVLPWDDDAPAAPPLPDLSLRQFASLSVELERNPTQRQLLLSRYRVPDEATFAALDAHWRGQIQRDSAQAAEYARCRQHYLDWLASQR